MIRLENGRRRFNERIVSDYIYSEAADHIIGDHYPSYMYSIKKNWLKRYNENHVRQWSIDGFISDEVKDGNVLKSVTATIEFTRDDGVTIDFSYALLPDSFKIIANCDELGINNEVLFSKNKFNINRKFAAEDFGIWNDFVDFDMELGNPYREDDEDFEESFRRNRRYRR